MRALYGIPLYPNALPFGNMSTILSVCVRIGLVLCAERLIQMMKSITCLFYTKQEMQTRNET